MTSITSFIYAGLVENGRRYQTKREGEYWGPSDEKQWESMNAAHIVYMILDSREKNRLFRSPIDEGEKRLQNILDVGGFVRRRLRMLIRAVNLTLFC